ncbi:MAG: TonB-dependent receptor [Sandaracinus sp.]
MHRRPSESRATRSRVRALAMVVVAGLAMATPSPLRADGTADEADLQFRLGNDAYREGDYLEALEHFLASNRLAPNRNVIFNIARAYQRLEMFPEAYRYFAEALAVETEPATRQRLEASLAEIAPRVALFEVETTPPNAEIYVDRVDLGSVGRSPRTIALAPGSYRVIARLDGHHDAASEPQSVAAGQRVHVALSLSRIVGTLVVTGDEGAEVRVDLDEGEPLCRIPCELPLPPGQHLLHVRAPGHEPTSRAVAIVEGESARTSVALEDQTGSVVVRADVEDALVQIDGAAVGFTPLVAPGIAVGTRTVRVSARGYEPAESAIEVTPDGQVELTDVRLRPLREVSAASRTVERIEDAPASVSVVSAEEIRAFRYPTILEALRGQRGFALTSDGIYSNASVRGIGQPSDYNNRLLILSDGATLNENILYQAFIGYDGRVDLGDVERVEIVRGAGSVLYGTGAVSGVVNLVPRAHDEPTGARFDVSLSDGNVGRGRAAFQLHLADDAGLRGAVSVARSDGRDATMLFDSDGDGVPDRNVARSVDAFEAITGTVRGWVGPLVVQALYTARGLTVPTGSFGSIFNRPENRYDDHRGLLEVRFEPRLSDEVELRTRVYANYTYFHLDYLYGAEDPVTMAPFEQPYQETYHGLWVGGEARVVAQVVPQLRVSGGAEGAYHPLVSMRISQREADGAQTQLLDTSNPFGTVAGYLLADWEPVRELRISAGGRVDGWLLPAPAESFVSVNPRLAVIVHLSAVDTLKLMGGRAFRAPSTYEQFYNDGGHTSLSSTCCGRGLRPEAMYSAELEYTHHFDDDWSVLLSGYAQYADDFIDTLPVPTAQDPMGLGLVHFANVAADQVSAGGDVEVRRELRNGWMFSANAGGLYASYLDQPDAEGATANRRVPNAPYVFGSTRAIFPILDRLLRGAIRLSVEAPRRVSLTSNEETGWAVVADVVASGEVEELGLSYSLGVYNLFDWQYSLPVSSLAAPVLPQRGRSFMLSLSLAL